MTTAQKSAVVKPRTGSYWTDGRRLMQIRRSSDTGATLEDARSPMDAPDLIWVPWQELEEDWERVVRRRGA